jgi:cytochrome P450
MSSGAQSQRRQELSFLEEYEKAAVGLEPAAAAKVRAELTGRWLAERPKEFFRELRENRPIFRSPALTFVTTYADVLEVLSRDDVFSVRLYAPKMQRIAPSGFILGLEDSPQYARDVSVLRLVFSRNDLTRIREFVAHTAAQIIEGVAEQRRFDLVSDLSRVIPARLVAEYFGVPGPDAATLMRWARAIFHDLFLNLQDLPQVREPALASAQALAAYLDDLIVRRKQAMASGEAVEENVLNRLLRLQSHPETHFDDAKIRDNLVGMLVGAIDTNSKAIAHVMDELLNRPEQLDGARQAAIEGEDERLDKYINEALRFKPQSIGLLRYTEREYTLAKGTPRETPIPAKTLVFVGTWSAMFDPARIDTTDEFRVDRSIASDYLHFGAGLHTCAGQYISRVLILETVKQLLLRLEGLRRAEGKDGQIRLDGPFPDAFMLEFERARPNSFQGEKTMSNPQSAGAAAAPVTQPAPPPATKDVHSYLTCITPVIPSRLERLKATLAQLSDPSRTSPIAAISTIHFARWVLIDNDTRLLFTSNFDGTLDSYLDEFIEKASGGLDAIWSNCEGYPAGGAKDVAAFKKYVHETQFNNTLVYTAYPDATVREIKQALRTRRKFEDFLEEFQS